MYWKKAMITTSASSMPYSRKFAFRCPPLPMRLLEYLECLPWPYPFRIMRMMRSWLASAAASSPTIAPSFIT